MLVMGLSGGLDPIHRVGVAVSHDSAAVLMRDGKVIAAVEEERLNRIKHTNKFPANAIRACLAMAGAELRDVDRFAFNFTEASAREDLLYYVMRSERVSSRLGLDPSVDTDPRGLLQAIFARELGVAVDRDRLHFVKHHVTHAFSAFSPSGFERALVVTMDGEGNNESGYVAIGSEHGIEILRASSVPNSLGLLYTNITHFLGFTYHDEFKVMGLVPYGDPAVYRHLFNDLYSLGPEGTYELHNERLAALAAHIRPRVRTEPFGRDHENVAASLQEALETIAFHVLTHFRKVTAIDDLCLAGGVAHNCTLNGKILASGLFRRVYVQPASHDAGCALGAALYASTDGHPGTAAQRAGTMPHVLLGTDIGDPPRIEQALEAWGSLLRVRRSTQVAKDAAELLAAGGVIGWVQGRAEFGPRALGNRSILADPRPAANKEIINAMVKKREGFRPFAPAVLEERARDYFEVPEATADLGHMTYVLPVRPEMRSTLGAITHVDGSARVQTVRHAENPRYWSVIHAFGELSGVAVLLNTSFNNNAEPIVDTVDDAVVAFLTTKLNHLVVDDFVIDKNEVSFDACRELVPQLCKHVSLHQAKRLNDAGVFSVAFYLGNSHDSRTFAVSPDAYRLLSAADGRATLGALVSAVNVDGPSVFSEFFELWSRRLVTLMPGAQNS